MMAGALMSLVLAIGAEPVSTRWPDKALPVRYVVASSVDNEGGTQLNGGMTYHRAVEVIDAALSVWTTPYVATCPGPTAWDMKNEGQFGSPKGSAAISAVDGANRVIFLSGSNWKASSTVLAQAVVTSYVAQPHAETFDADIQINNNYSWSEACPGEVGAYDLPTVVAHEAGHFMGISHQTAAKSVMQPELIDGYCLRALSTEDVNAVCGLYPNPCPAAGVLCRPAKGLCDFAEVCPAAGAACPPDEFFTSETICRAPVGPCDVVEQCTGMSAQCPVDVLQPSTVQCRAAATECDVPEFCSGESSLCPADGRAVYGADCDGGICQGGFCQANAPLSGGSPQLPAKIGRGADDEAPCGCSAVPTPWGAMVLLWWAVGLLRASRKSMR